LETSGLRFGTSLNSLGLTKDSEISEMTSDDVEQKRAELLQYLTREKTEHKGEKLKLGRFWL
jgi:ribosomal protein L29